VIAQLQLQAAVDARTIRIMTGIDACLRPTSCACQHRSALHQQQLQYNAKGI
jgi:hypothetical protein